MKGRIRFYYYKDEGFGLEGSVSSQPLDSDGVGIALVAH